jgi:2-methylcitrate dehydratase PrpD
MSADAMIPDVQLDESASATLELAKWVAEFEESEITDRALAWGRHAILDWFGVTLAGMQEPLSVMVLEEALADGGSGKCSVIGRPEKLPASWAAMVNGTASHALDYDDVNARLHGHPTVPIVPALLAMGEERGISGRDMLLAFVAGYEAECQIGDMMGNNHYQHGWHATATIGTFGAAAACSRLLGLDAERTATALGIAATQAAGLKSMFGTMCKPMHAGKAAMNGLLAARLAARGFSSRTDSLECIQGFGATQSNEFRPLAPRPDPAAPFAVERNLFKYHAACYLTHAGIDAAIGLREGHDFKPEDVSSVKLAIPAGHLKVCNILDPQTGLETKFSLRHTTAFALTGEDTGALETYSDELAQRPDLVDLRRRIEIDAREDDSIGNWQAELKLDMVDGTTLIARGDVGAPANDTGEQWTRLATKFSSLVEPIHGPERVRDCIDACANLGDANALDGLLELMSGK